MDKVKKDILKRVFLVYFTVLLFGLWIIGKAAYIQFVQGDELALKADQQELEYFNIEAARGNILDRNNLLLATSIPIFEVRMDPNSHPISDQFFIENVDSLAIELASLFQDRSTLSYKNKLVNARNTGNRYLLIKRNVSYEQLKVLRQFPIFKKGRYGGGLIIIPKTYRKLPYRTLAKRTIGYENKEEDIKVGLEGAYSDYLTGRNGKQLRRKLNNGDWIPVADKNELEPETGKDIITTIDVNIQDVAERALNAHLIEHEATQGCAILMEVKTGEIRAIANLKLNTNSGLYEESYNFAVGSSIEPGSTFKLASMIAALETGQLKLTDTVDTHRGYVIHHRREMRDVHVLRDGKITYREAFEHSSNVGISLMISKVFSDDQQGFIDLINAMSLNQVLNIEIPGEGKPVIKNPGNRNSWSATTLTSMSIGYEVQLTPLHLLTFYNAVANDGVMVKPMFVKEIYQSGRIIKKFKPQIIIKSICSKSTIDTVKTLLEGVVERGTAKSLNKCLYKVAGKTGTAKIALGSQGYSSSDYNASFIGYFPADKPAYTCIVVVNKPTKGKIYGGNVAAPVFKEIADRVYATHLDLVDDSKDSLLVRHQPEKGIGYAHNITQTLETLGYKYTNDSPQEWVILSDTEQEIHLDNKSMIPGRVPDFSGMSAKDAIYLSETLKLEALIKGRGKVESQSLVPGSFLREGEQIILSLNTAK